MKRSAETIVQFTWICIQAVRIIDSLFMDWPNEEMGRQRRVTEATGSSKVAFEAAYWAEGRNEVGITIAIRLILQ